MPRYKFGPTVGPVHLVVPVPTDPATKADVEVAFAGYSPEGVFRFSVPAYDLATHHQLDAVHVGLYPVGAAVPADPAEILAAPHHFSMSCSALVAGGDVAVDATDSPEGDWDALAVLEFAE